MLKEKLQCFDHLIKRPWCWEGLKTGEGDERGWDGWMASPTQWTWVWVNYGSWWWTGKPDVLQSMGSQRVGHDWTELKLHVPVTNCPGKCHSTFNSLNCLFYYISWFGESGIWGRLAWIMLLFHVTLTRSLGVQLVNQVHDSVTHLSGVSAEWPEGRPQLGLSSGAPTGSPQRAGLRGGQWTRRKLHGPLKWEPHSITPAIFSWLPSSHQGQAIFRWRGIRAHFPRVWWEVREEGQRICSHLEFTTLSDFRVCWNAQTMYL